MVVHFTLQILYYLSISYLSFDGITALKLFYAYEKNYLVTNIYLHTFVLGRVN